MEQMMNLSSTKKFRDIWNSENTFVSEYTSSFANGSISTENAKNLFWLMFGKHANDSICNFDEDQWKVKFFSVCFQYGPTWQKKLELQARIRNLTEDELREGAKSIMNAANNPGTAPADSELQELRYISNQNVSNLKKSKITAIADQYTMLETDVTESFLNRFKPLFKTVLYERPVMYESDN